MKNLLITIVLTILFGAVSPIANAQNKYFVTVNIKNIKERKGKIYATLTADADNFPSVESKVGSAVAEVSAEGEVIVIFKDVPMGEYAIVLFQDLNDNHELDMNGQMPAEPFGFSELTMLMGPPSFDACAFKVDADKTKEISLISF